MNCEEFQAAYLSGDNSPDVVSHLEGCATCRSSALELIARREALSEPSLWEEPPPQLAEQVESLIGSAAHAEPGSHPSRRRWWMSLGGAAALVAVVAVWAVLRPAAPHWVAELDGTGDAPTASATVAGWNTDSGTRLVLDAEGLDPAPAGYVYEFWLSDDGHQISAGTFTHTDDVELWAGVKRGDFPRLWVTLEPLDDDPSPSRQTVLDNGYTGTPGGR